MWDNINDVLTLFNLEVKIFGKLRRGPDRVVILPVFFFCQKIVDFFKTRGKPVRNERSGTARRTGSCRVGLNGIDGGIGYAIAYLKKMSLVN